MIFQYRHHLTDSPPPDWQIRGYRLAPADGTWWRDANGLDWTVIRVEGGRVTLWRDHMRRHPRREVVLATMTPIPWRPL